MIKASAFMSATYVRSARGVSRADLHSFLLLLILTVAAGGTTLAACAASAIEPAATIKMTDQLTFTPAQVTVKVGETVEWKNSSLLVHTVTADPKLAAKSEDVALPKGAEPFDSGNIEPDGTFQRRFKVAGTYRYYCIPHEGAGMVGEVVVKEAGG